MMSKQRKRRDTRKGIAPAGMFRSPLFSPAIKVGNLIFVSGTVALDANGRVVAESDFRGQAEFVFQSLEKVLKEASSGIDRLVRVTVFLTDASNYHPHLNDVW